MKAFHCAVLFVGDIIITRKQQRTKENIVTRLAKLVLPQQTQKAFFFFFQTPLPPPLPHVQSLPPHMNVLQIINAHLPNGDL